MAKNSLSLFSSDEPSAEAFKMWIWGARFPVLQSCGKPIFFHIYIIIYACLATFNFKAAGVSLTHLMLVLLRCFSYTPQDSSSEMFLLHTPC